MTETNTEKTATPGNPFMAPGLYRRKGQEEDDLDVAVTDSSKAADGDNPGQDDTDATQTDRPDLNPEEKTYKKRYGDLRRYAQQQVTAKEQEIKTLREQLNAVNNKEVSLPKTAADIEKFREQFPDVYDTFLTVARSEIKTERSQLDAKLNEIREQQEDNLREKAVNRLQTIHPDFEELKMSQDFHDWAAEQPTWVQNALYENQSDADACARAIDLYKADRGIPTSRAKKPKKEDEERDAVRKVVNTRRTDPPRVNEKGEKVWKLSDIQKMSARQYEAVETEIEKAYAEGRISND